MEQHETEHLETLLEKKDMRALREALVALNEVDAAAFVETQEIHHAAMIFRMLPKERGAEIFAHLAPEMQQHVVGAISDHEVGQLIEELFVDDAVDFLEEMPASLVKRVLRNATPDTRAIINQYLRYPDNSAGSIMTAEFVDLRPAMTVADAIARIRRTGLDKETVYTCYVIDNNRVLQGIVTVRQLLMAGDAIPIEAIMKTDVLFARTLEDREEVAKLFARYDLLSLPVVDHERRLVGIVTVDDAVDVLEQEATEDFEIMAAIMPSEKPYLKTSVLTLAKNRLLWLIVLMFSAMLTGSVLAYYDDAFAALPVLVTFIPMLMNTGGNAGSQSATMIIRGMALSQISMRDAARVLFKEFRVALLVGAGLAAANFVRILIMYDRSFMLALTVSLSLYCTVIAAKAVGSLLPMAAKALKLDPAIMASPLISTIVDALSLLVYFGLAQLLLGIVP